MKKNFRILPTLLLLLILINNSCKKEPLPTVEFTFSPASALVNETITFTNTSQDATTYSWDFGDGSSSTSQNPTHSYATSGTFTITLIATGDGGTNSATKTITISYPAPVASFTMDKTTANTGETITFTNTSQNAKSYSWNFGDGSSSTNQHPTHSYSTVETFTITLTATGDGGTNSTTKSIEITKPPFNIIPGVRIGDFKLGDNIQKFRSFITDTYVIHVTFRMTDGTYYHYLDYYGTGVGFYLINNSASVYNSDVPYAILAFPPFQGNTEKGITFGSLLTEVEKAYGTPEQISSGQYYSGSYYYNSLGIEFWADSTKTKVDKIYIAKPESTGKSGKPFFKSEKISISEFILNKDAELRRKHL